MNVREHTIREQTVCGDRQLENRQIIVISVKEYGMRTCLRLPESLGSLCPDLLSTARMLGSVAIPNCSD